MISKNNTGISEFELLKKSFKETVKDILPKIGLEEMIRANYSDKLDQMILAEKVRSESEYVGGQFNVVLLNEKFFKLAIEMYFHDKNQKWLKQSVESDPLQTKYLNKKDFAELSRSKKISYEIDAPKSENKAE